MATVKVVYLILSHHWLAVVVVVRPGMYLWDTTALIAEYNINKVHVQNVVQS
jgi:hypothetical protein